MAVICKEKRKLLEAYQEITEKYAAVVADMRRNMGTVSKVEFDSLYQATELLHAEVTRAQSELNIHVVSHGC